MSNDLVIFEQQLKPLAPAFNDMLGGIMPAERLIQTAVVAVQKNPKLLLANRQSFLNTIRGSAILGLEMDGVTGQAFPIPFGGVVQLVIGYKGYNTLGARAGLTITGEVVREGDPFDFDVGEGWVKHKPQGGDGRILGAWAKAAANDRPAIISWLPIGDLMKIKAKSPGAKKQDSPWNDPNIGFPAMCSKSAKRRLSRSTPLSVEAPQMHLAARMEESFEERGRPAYVTPAHDVIEMNIDAEPGQPTPAELLAKKPSELLQTARAKAFEGEQAVLAWWGTLEKWQQRELQQELPDLRRIAKDPLNFLLDEGREAAHGGPHALKAWWENMVPAEWKPKLEAAMTEFENQANENG